MQKITTFYWIGSQSICETHPPLVEIGVTLQWERHKQLNTVTE